MPAYTDSDVRFCDRFVEDPETGCWVWTHSKTKGYGRLVVRCKHLLAHRYGYELFVGPIPKGLVLDHLCRNKACVNPGHLEPVTSRENTLRGDTIPARHARKTHCIHGHEFTPENTITEPRGRRCRTCYRAWKRNYERNKVVAAGGKPRLKRRLYA